MGTFCGLLIGGIMGVNIDTSMKSFIEHNSVMILRLDHLCRDDGKSQTPDKGVYGWGTKAEVREHVLPKNARSQVNALDLSGREGLVALVLDNSLETCQLSSSNRPVLQLSSSGYEAVIAAKSPSHSQTIQRIRYDEKVIESVIKGHLFDELVDSYLAGGNVDLEAVRASNSFFAFLAVPAWLAFVVGAVSFYFFNKKVLVTEPISAAAELKLLRTDVEYRDKPRPTLARNSLLPASSDDFRKWMKIITEFCVDYYEHPDVYTVRSDVKPGFLFSKMPRDAPEEPEKIESVIREVYEKIMPGLRHWQHPRFHAYYTGGSSYADVVGEALVSSLGTVGFSWDANPSLAELELTIMNWIGRAFGLPESFLYNSDPAISTGGGAMQSGASDSIFNAVNTAKYRAIESRVDSKNLDKQQKHEKSCEVLKKLVAYTSAEAHSCIEKACKVAMVRLCSIEPKGDFYSMTADQVEHEVIKDIERGYTPFYVHVSLGTTNTCAFDNLKEIVKVAKKYDLWVHIDAAYAGSFFVCPEFRYLMEGIEDADSIDINLQKHFLMMSSASMFWTRHKDWHQRALSVSPTYLKEHEGTVDFRNWSTMLCRRSTCVKVWFLLKLYGIKNMQKFVRRMVDCGTRMHNHIAADPRFEIVGKQVLGLNCFKVRHSDPKVSSQMTQELLEYCNRSRKIALTRANPQNVDIIRISTNFNRSNDEEVDKSWKIVSELADEYFLLSTGPKTFRTQLQLENGICTSPAVQTEATVSARSSMSRMDVTNNNETDAVSPRTARLV